MTKTPYQIQLDDLPITVEYTNIEMPHFVEPLADFSDGADGSMHLQGKWRDRHMRNAADFTVRITFWGNDTARQYSRLEFAGRFSISRYGGFEPSYLAERIGKFCYSLIETYVEEKPIRDKNKVLYPVPKFKFFENQWPRLAFDLP